MRRHSLLRTLVTFVLIIWTPWCFCGVRATAQHDEARPGDAATHCCECCTSSSNGASEGPTDELPCVPGDHCGAGCCHPRTPDLVPPVTLSVDTIGTHFDFTFEWTDCAPAATWSERYTWNWPPGAVGRQLLLQSSELRT